MSDEKNIFCPARERRGDTKRLIEKINADMLKRGTLTYDNALHYRGYLIYHNYSGWPSGHRHSFVHEDYDGAPDAHDHRHGGGATVEDCVREINRIITESE